MLVDGMAHPGTLPNSGDACAWTCASIVTSIHILHSGGLRLLGHMGIILELLSMNILT